MLKFVTTYVRPLIEFSTSMFSPISTSDTNKQEKVQKYITNEIQSCSFSFTTSVLTYSLSLSFSSLQHRRIITMSHSLSCFRQTHIHPQPTFAAHSTIKYVRSQPQYCNIHCFIAIVYKPDLISRTASILELTAIIYSRRPYHLHFSGPSHCSHSRLSSHTMVHSVNNSPILLSHDIPPKPRIVFAVLLLFYNF